MYIEGILEETDVGTHRYVFMKLMKRAKKIIITDSFRLPGKGHKTELSKYIRFSSK